jgi:AraC family transcriptional regulator of arabinose operon
MAIPRQVDFRLGRVLQAAEDNPSTTIPHLAGLVNLSCSRLSHLFKAQTGLGLKNFLTDQRLERSAYLLRTTGMRVKEITYNIGYSQESSFVRAFRKKFHCSPTRYRNQQQQQLLLRNSRFG